MNDITCHSTQTMHGAFAVEILTVYSLGGGKLPHMQVLHKVLSTQTTCTLFPFHILQIDNSCLLVYKLWLSVSLQTVVSLHVTKMNVVNKIHGQYYKLPSTQENVVC